jgi:hypothetical protein
MALNPKVRKHKAIIPGLALVLLYVTPLTTAQDESPLVVSVERIITSKEPNWCYIRGIQSGRVPRVASEKILVTSSWERKRKGGKREGVSVNIYEVSSDLEAGRWLKPISTGEVASGWKVEKYPIGDEAYLIKSENRRRYSLHFRKNNIVVEVNKESLDNVKRFAQHVISGITAI